MFVESLLESGNVHHKGRGWATTLSITLQALLLAALVALPIFRPDKILLESKSITSPVAFGRQDAPPERPPRPAVRPNTPAPAADSSTVYRPSSIPRLPGSDTADAIPPGISDIPVGRPDGNRDVVNSIISRNPPVVHVRPDPVPSRRVSIPDPGKIVYQVQPIYPTIAKQSGVEGAVVMRAVIDREGHIVNLQVVSGNVLLQQEARRAVSQWRYRPYLLNGQPVEVETQITVNFKLNR